MIILNFLFGVWLSNTEGKEDSTVPVWTDQGWLEELSSSEPDVFEKLEYQSPSHDSSEQLWLQTCNFHQDFRLFYSSCRENLCNIIWLSRRAKRKKRIKKHLKSLLTEALFCVPVQRSEKDFSSLRWSELAQQLRSRNDAFTDAPEDQRNYLLSSFCGWTRLICLSAWVHKCWCDVDSVKKTSLQGGYRLLLQNQTFSFLYSFGIPSLTGLSKTCSTPGIFYFRLV